MERDDESVTRGARGSKRNTIERVGGCERYLRLWLGRVDLIDVPSWGQSQDMTRIHCGSHYYNILYTYPPRYTDITASDVTTRAERTARERYAEEEWGRRDTNVTIRRHCSVSQLGSTVSGSQTLRSTYRQRFEKSVITACVHKSLQ